MAKKVRNARRATAAIACTAAVCLASGCTNKAASPGRPPAPPRVMAGVTVGSTPVGGLTAGEAKHKLVLLARDIVASKIDVRDVKSKRRFHYRLSDFGLRCDVASSVRAALAAKTGAHLPMNMSVDRKKVAGHVDLIAQLLDTPVYEPRVRFTSDGGFVPGSRGRAGRSVNEKASIDGITAAVLEQPLPAKVADLRFKTLKPRVSLASLGGLNDVLETFRTTFHPYLAERSSNLSLAAHNISGDVVGPGEVFSFNDSVGPRTHETGFKDAIIYVRDKMKKDVGGGICQVSSTLYNCVLLANFEIVERHCHSLPVYYVAPGRDATVAWGGDDFKFRNTSSKPVVIRTSVAGGTLTEMLIGDKNALPHPSARVAIDVSPRRTYKDGFAVSAFRVVKENGVLLAREPLGYSFYHFPVGPEPR